MPNFTRMLSSKFFKIWNIQIQGLFKDFQGLSRALNFFPKFKDFQGLLKDPMNPDYSWLHVVLWEGNGLRWYTEWYTEWYGVKELSWHCQWSQCCCGVCGERTGSRWLLVTDPHQLLQHWITTTTADSNSSYHHDASRTSAITDGKNGENARNVITSFTGKSFCLHKQYSAWAMVKYNFRTEHYKFLSRAA